MFSDNDIAAAIETGEIIIYPNNDDRSDGIPATLRVLWDRLQPASLDLTLGAEFKRPILNTQDGDTIIDFKRDHSALLEDITITHGFFALAPYSYALGSTAETIELSNGIVANVAGKSSLARLGLAVHITAGLVDPGFRGSVTLEFFNHSPYWMKLWRGMPICQASFERLDSPSVKGYVGKYTGQAGPTASRYHLNWSEETQSWK